MNKDKKQIEVLKGKVNNLLPELNLKKEVHDKASSDFYKISREVNSLQREIDAIEKKMRVETFKKAVGKRELISFRQFFKEIRSGRDFTEKTIVWSFKNGKSGMFVNLHIRNDDVSKKLLDSYYKREIYNPDDIISIVKDFPSLDFEGFEFDAFTVGSMVDRRIYYDKKLDDVFIFISDTKTLDDFENIVDTKELYFFKHLPYTKRSSGKTYKSGSDEIDYLTLGDNGIPKSHYGSYKLYPLKTKGIFW